MLMLSLIVVTQLVYIYLEVAPALIVHHFMEHNFKVNLNSILQCARLQYLLNVKIIVKII